MVDGPGCLSCSDVDCSAVVDFTVVVDSVDISAWLDEVAGSVVKLGLVDGLEVVADGLEGVVDGLLVVGSDSVD